MATIGDVTIRIGATTRQLESDLKRAERALQKSADKFSDLGEKLSLGVTVPFTAFAAVSLQAFGESEKAIGQVNAALTSTGNTANKTTEELKQTAASLQDISTFDDDEILGKVTANLLTFTSVANEQFDKAQLAIVNLSTRLGTDLQSATLQVGKALNDPIGGLTSLKKAGIQFSDEQKNLIKGFVETNQIAKAQDVILAELEKQFGGSAEAAAKLGLGPLKQLQNQLGNLSEEFGAIIAEAILPLIQFFKNLVGSLQGMDNATKKTIVTLGALFAAVGPILIVIGQMISVYKSVIVEIYKVIGAIVAKATAEKAAAVATNAANASTVAFTTALRATLTVAAPYLALFGAIAGAAFLLYQNFKKAEAAQDQLNGVQQEANKIMAAEKAQGDRLISVINDETKSKQDKKKALNELITISPEYFKGLTIEKDGIEKINSRYKDYVANLKAVSLARAASSKQDELSVKILDLEDEKIRQLAEAQKLETQAKAESERQGASLERQGVNYSRTALENTKKRIKAIDTELIALNKQSDALSNVIEKNSQITPQGKTVVPEFAETKTDNKLLETFKGLNDELVILERRFKAGIIDSVEFSQGKVEVLRKKFIELIDAGTDPVNKSVVQLKDNIASLQKVSAAPFVGILSSLDGVVVKSDKTKESIKDLADKMGKSFVDISNRSRTDFVERIVSDLQTGMDVIKSFASTMEGTLISAFTLVGETIGKAFTGDSDIDSFFNNILQLVASFAKDFGKQLIAIGVAKLALEELFAAGPVGAAAAIIAGTALVAASSALSSSLQKKLPSLAIGTDRVKSDGMAYLHAGEAVVPADVVAGGFTGGSNGTQIFGRLSGIDLLLSNQYAGGYYNRLR